MTVIQGPGKLGKNYVIQGAIKLGKNYVIQGAGKLGKNDTTWGQANSTGVLPDQKVNKDEERTCLYIRIYLASELQLLPPVHYC
jgi:hypothetical protein